MKKEDLEKVVYNFMKYFDPNVKVEVKEDDGNWNVNIDAENSGLLIGRFGETLNSFQYLIRLMASKLSDSQRVSLSVDIGDYKGKKNREIEELALQMAENVKNSGYGQSLRPMNSYERRVVHVALKDFPGIEAVSVGEEPYRCIEIKPKSK